jgi:hypothetical protein
MEMVNTREEWLNALTDRMRPVFEENGYDLPAVRLSIGFPSTGRRGKRIGECWDGSASADNTNEILIRPDRYEELDVAQILCHELIHAAVGCAAKHGPKFRKAALALGLVGPMRSTTAGPEFIAWVSPILQELGPIPHAALGLGLSSGPKKQGTRLLKAFCECDGCGYTVRLARKWVEEIGPPVCPAHMEPMVVPDMADEDPGEGDFDNEEKEAA